MSVTRGSLLHGEWGQSEDGLYSLDVFEYCGEVPVQGEFFAIGEAEDAAFLIGRIREAEVGDGVVADVSQGGGSGGHFQGYENGAVIESDAGATHVGEKFAAGGVVISHEFGYPIHVLVYGAVWFLHVTGVVPNDALAASTFGDGNDGGNIGWYHDVFLAF